MENSTNTKNVQMNVQLMFPDHSKEFQCPICAKYFSRKFTLDAHMLIHKGEKPYPCPFCGKSFRQKGTLMRHKALHSAKSLFHCSLCNRGFRQKNVFLHHLKHRHNVSTETLDRRKYRTGLKDYQSIMDTLPPFVQADSTAIASSEKHLDAMLLQSIKKHVNNSCAALNNDSLACESMLQPDANLDISKLDCMLNDDNLSFQNHENHSAHCNGTEFNHDQETLVNQEFREDIKPGLSNTFNEVDNTVLSDACYNAPYVYGTAIVGNGSINNISSSNDFDDENLTCIPCQLSFTSKIEFKCHVKTHVQSVLLGDVNSSALAVSDKSINSKSYLLPPAISSIRDESKNTTNQTHLIPNSTNSSNEMCFPIKSEMSNFNSESSLIENSYISNTYVSESNLNNNMLKCLICKLSFKSEESFKKHSEMHNSYDLLKFMSKFSQGKKYFCFHQNFRDISNSSDKIGQVNMESTSDHLKLKVQKDDRKCDNKNVKKCVKNNTRYVNNISKLISLTRFMCLQCDKKFSNKYLFEYHRQLHLSAKGFLCKSCNRRFSNKTMLLSHTRLHHMKTFVCRKCSKVFNYKSFFNSHYQECKSHVNEEMSNGSVLNFPLISIESLSNSNPEGIIGIIPICNTLLSSHKSDLKVGIPVMSLSHLKSLYLCNNLNSKAD